MTKPYYTPLRGLKPEVLQQEAALFPVRDAVMYIPSRRLGLRGKAFQGAAFYSAANPSFGATFTYHLKESILTRKEKRLAAEKAAGKKAVPYPTRAELRAEAEEEAPTMLLTISDATGTVVRTITGPVTKGFHRVSWDLREPAPSLPRPRPRGRDEDLFAEEPAGPLVMPGVYTVALAKRVGGVTTPLGEPRAFRVVVDGEAVRKPADVEALHAFQQQVLRLERAVAGALAVANGLTGRLEQIKKALDHTPSIDARWKETARELEKRNRAILRALRGDVALRARNENTPMAITERVENIVDEQRFSLSPPTSTQRQAYAIASAEFAAELAKLRTLVQVDLKKLEKALDAAGAPWTPGRLPEWKEK